MCIVGDSKITCPAAILGIKAYVVVHIDDYIKPHFSDSIQEVLLIRTSNVFRSHNQINAMGSK